MQSFLNCYPVFEQTSTQRRANVRVYKGFTKGSQRDDKGVRLSVLVTHLSTPYHSVMAPLSDPTSFRRYSDVILTIGQSFSLHPVASLVLAVENAQDIQSCNTITC